MPGVEVRGTGSAASLQGEEGFGRRREVKGCPPWQSCNKRADSFEKAEHEVKASLRLGGCQVARGAPPGCQWEIGPKPPKKRPTGTGCLARMVA